MKKALIITVGVGVGENREEATDSLAHGIAFSIKNSNPTKISFVVTNESKEITFPIIKEYVKDLPEYEFMILDEKEKDDVESVYKKTRERIEKYQNEDYEVVVDFTSGTKAMSSGAVLAGAEKNCNLRYITGERERGVVVKGTERAVEISPIYFFINRQEGLIKELFNLYQFDACFELIEEVKQTIAKRDIIERMEKYEKLAKAYSMWDKFDHKSALEILNGIGREFDIGENKKFLNLLNKAKWKEEFLIPDLINNARRRIEEGKYDDAVARLYRCIEMIAQYRLKSKYELDPSSIEFGDLERYFIHETKLLEKYKKCADENGIIKLALKADYQLLKDLGDEIGGVIEDGRLKDMLKKRNESILAHGITPISKNDAEELYEKVVEVAKNVIVDLEEKMKIAEFPKL